MDGPILRKSAGHFCPGAKFPVFVHTVCNLVQADFVYIKLKTVGLKYKLNLKIQRKSL